MATKATEFSDLVQSYRRRAIVQAGVRTLLTASKLGSAALIAAACLRLPWPAIPPIMPVAAAILVFSGSLIAGIRKEMHRDFSALAADSALDTGSLLVSALELELRPGRHDRSAALHTMQRARSELPAWRAAIKNVIGLPSPRLFLLPLALFLAGLAVLILRPGEKTRGTPESITDATSAVNDTTQQIAALRNSLRPAEPTKPRPVSQAEPRRSSDSRQRPNRDTRPSPAPRDATRLSQNDEVTTNRDNDRMRAVSGQGSRAGHVAATGNSDVTRGADVELDVESTDIERSGAASASSHESAATGFAADSAAAAEGFSIAMPPATLVTGATDYPLTPAERGYYERYRRYRETIH
jgi:hypothetical protein